MNATAEPDSMLVLSRTFNTPLERVYKVWTDVELAKEWWGPEGCETHELLCEARPGGKFRWVLSGPDGERMVARGEFREVRPGEKIVYTWKWDNDPQWENHESVVTVEFDKKDDETTELRLTHEDLPSKESRDNHVGGWNSAMDKLERLLAGG